MSAPAATRTHVIHLYRSMLRNAGRFSSYNFRDYAHRRVRDAFRANAAESDQAKIADLVRTAEYELKMLERQSLVNSMYSGDRLVIENERRNARG